MIKTIEKTTTVLGKEIRAIIVYTDCGINVTVAGGDKSHIGAVAIIDENGNLTSTTFPNHKETIIAESWANTLHEKYMQSVVVAAGIHYDGINKEGINKVVEASGRLLEYVVGL